jgi:Type II secretion system (T2SS), protein M subtype b
MKAALRDNHWLRHAVFILTNLALATVALQLVVFPTSTLLSERDDEIAQQRQLLARLSAMAAQAPTVQKFAEQGGAIKDRPEFLRGPNQSVITADLQGRLSGMTQSAGARVRSIRSLPPQTIDGITFVGAQVELSGPLRAVQQTVYSIETASPFLFIMGAAIKPSPQATFAGAGTGAGAALTLDARLDVVGALQPEERN